MRTDADTTGSLGRRRDPKEIAEDAERIAKAITASVERTTRAMLDGDVASMRAAMSETSRLQRRLSETNDELRGRTICI